MRLFYCSLLARDALRLGRLSNMLVLVLLAQPDRFGVLIRFRIFVVHWSLEVLLVSTSHLRVASCIGGLEGSIKRSRRGLGTMK